MYLKLVLAVAFVAICGADSMGHIFVDIGLNGIRITNKLGMELDIKTNKHSGLYEEPMIKMEMIGTELETPMMLIDRQVGYEGMRQSDILFHIFRKFTGPVSYMDCQMLLTTLAKHVETGEIDITILKALRIICQLDKDSLMMDRMYEMRDVRDRDVMMHKIPMSYRRLGLFEGRRDTMMSPMMTSVMYPRSYSMKENMMDHTMYPRSSDMFYRTLYPRTYDMKERTMYPRSYDMLDRTMYPRSEGMLDRTMYPRSERMLDRTMYPRSEGMLDRTMYPRSERMLDRTMYPRSEGMMDRTMYPRSDDMLDRTMYPRSYDVMDTMKMPMKTYYRDLMMNPMRMRMMRGDMMDTRMMGRMHDKMFEHRMPCCA